MISKHKSIACIQCQATICSGHQFKGEICITVSSEDTLDSQISVYDIPVKLMYLINTLLDDFSGKYEKLGYISALAFTCGVVCGVDVLCGRLQQ